MNFLRSRDVVSGVINFILSTILCGGIGGGILNILKKRVSRYGREATKDYLTYECRRRLKKAALNAATQLMILAGIINLIDILNNILNPGGWIFDTFLDKDGNGMIG